MMVPMGGMRAYEAYLRAWTCQFWGSDSLSALTSQEYPPGVRSTAAILLLLARPGTSVRHVAPLLCDEEPAVHRPVSQALIWHGGNRVREAVEALGMPDGVPNAVIRALELPSGATAPAQQTCAKCENTVSGTPIFVVGPTGCGKSTVLKLAARHFNGLAIDLDHEIEKLHGLPGYEIFRLLGADVYRDTERQLLHRIEGRRCLVAVGAGAVDTVETRRFLERIGIVVHYTRDGAGLKSATDIDPRERHAASEFMTNFCNFGELAAVVDGYRSKLYDDVSVVCVNASGLDPISGAVKLVAAIRGA